VIPLSAARCLDNGQGDEAKIIAERVALRKRAEEMAAMARGDKPKVMQVFSWCSCNSLEHWSRLRHDLVDHHPELVFH